MFFMKHKFVKTLNDEEVVVAWREKLMRYTQHTSTSYVYNNEAFFCWSGILRLDAW